MEQFNYFLHQAKLLTANGDYDGATSCYQEALSTLLKDSQIPSISDVSTHSVNHDIEDDGPSSGYLEIKPKVNLDNIVGYDSENNMIREFLAPYLYPNLVLPGPSRGASCLLLYGPPGTGKSMIAEAVCGEIRGKFLCVTPGTLLSKFVGEGEKNLRKVFERAKAVKPSVIFIDEFDGIAGIRNKTQENSVSLKMELLLLLDGSIDMSDVILVAATNFPNRIDAAILSRMTLRVKLPLPNQVDREKLLRHVFSNFQLQEEMRVQSYVKSLAIKCDRWSGRDFAKLKCCMQRAPFRIIADTKWFVKDAQGKFRIANSTDRNAVRYNWRYIADRIEMPDMTKDVIDAIIESIVPLSTDEVDSEIQEFEQTADNGSFSELKVFENREGVLQQCCFM